MVMPYACVEVLTVSFAVLAYARHAADGEWIALHRDRLMVEHAWGSRVQRVEFRRQWVRVGPQARNGSLVELSGQGEPSQWGATSVRN